MPQFDLNWVVHGTLRVHAATEDDAREQFMELSLDKVIQRTTTPMIEIDDIEESLPSGPDDPIKELMRKTEDAAE